MDSRDIVSGNNADAVCVKDADGREFIIVGVDAIAGDNSKMAERLIRQEQPDTVCVDLDGSRVKILSDESDWESQSIREVVQQKLLTALLLNLLLAAYQRNLDDTSRSMPGTQIYESLKVSEQLSIPVALVDRDLNVTFNRAANTIDYLAKLKLLLMALKRLFRRSKNGDEAAVDLQDVDVLTAFFGEAVDAQPELAAPLVTERNVYTAQKIASAPGAKIVALVGYGRVADICRTMLENGLFQANDLETVPSESPVTKWAKRALAILVVVGLFYIGWNQGRDFVRESLALWIAANSILSGLGALLAGAHITAILTAIIVAPISPLIPAGPGTVAALVQLIVRPPLVKDFQSFADNVNHPLQWRRNRILKLLLILILCGLGSILGSLLATSRILLSLFSQS